MRKSTEHSMNYSSGDPHRDDHYRTSAAIWGMTGDNGLMGTVKGHEARLTALEKVLHTAKWAGLMGAISLAWGNTETVGKLIAVVIKAML